MSSTNSFGLLVDDDTDDPAQLIAAAIKSAPVPASTQSKKAPTQAKPSVNLPSKPLPPAQAVREAKTDNQRGGRGSGHGGRGRGGRGFQRDFHDNENPSGNTNGGYRPSENTDAGKAPSERRPYGGPRVAGGFRGGRRGGFGDGEAADGERPRRTYDRHSGTGRGAGFKREGAGRGNWGTPTDEISTVTEEPVIEVEKNTEAEKQPRPDDAGDAKETSPTEPEEKEPEDKEMTLEEYEKVLEEKRKALVSLKSEERKVNLDKELENMQLLSNKKDGEVFAKLGSDKDKRKEAAEKVKKSVSINEFLKPAEGENYYRGGGRGQGRGRGRGGYGGNNNYNSAQAPAIEDVGEFPSLRGK